MPINISRRDVLAQFGAAGAALVFGDGKWTGADPATDVVVAGPRDFGAIGDGVTDDSAAIQAAIDAGRGKRVILKTSPAGGRYLCAGLVLGDSSYDDTQVVCDGAELVLAPDRGKSNFDTSIWAGIRVTKATRVTLDLKWHGNRTAISRREDAHCVVLAGASRTHVKSLVCRELRGDGLYIGRVSPITGGVPSSDVLVDSVRCVNSADDGRNAVSVISCDGLVIRDLFSYQIGGVIAGVRMPGGLDLEPNGLPGHSITDVVLKNINVVTAGSTGFAVQGQPNTNDGARDWNVRGVDVGYVRVRNTAGGYPLITRCRGVKGRIANTHDDPRGIGFLIDYADALTLELHSTFTTVGCRLGYSDWVNDSDLTIESRDYSQSGVEAIGVERSVIKAKVSAAAGGEETFGVYTRSNHRPRITQRDVTYEIDAPSDGPVRHTFANDTRDPVIFDSDSRVRTRSGAPIRLRPA